MPFASYRDGALWLDDVAAESIAQQWGTPCYVYSKTLLERLFSAFDQAFKTHPHKVCFAVKANSNLSVLGVLAKRGAGFDVVSGGELQRVILAGGRTQDAVFSGVGKSLAEMELALTEGIFCFNLESEQEISRLSEAAGRLGAVAPVALRVNPDVDANSHPYISTGLSENKFGIEIGRATALYLQIQQDPNLAIKGVTCHIGSQLTELAPLRAAYEIVLGLVEALEKVGISFEHIDLGGGFGISYQNETPPEPAQWIENLLAVFGHRQETLLIEPGRSIAASAGVLLTRVEYLKNNKNKGFVVVDAAMNDLMRPSLYQAWHDIVPVQIRPDQAPMHCDVVGPVCESGDFLGKDRDLNTRQGDLLAVLDAGAYGFTMSSNYNSRPRAAEILVDGSTHSLIRRRETMAQLWENEQLF